MFSPAERADIRRDANWQRLLQSYSVIDAIRGLASGQRHGVTREIHDELSRVQLPQHSNSVLVPWAALATRADTVASPTSGGYLVDTVNIGASDVLRPKLLCGPLGQTIINAEANANVSQPIQHTASTAYWMTAETSTIAETDQTFGQLNFSPHTVGAYTEISRLLRLQSPAEDVVRRDLVSVLARAIDRVQILGSGINGQPLGLTGVTGVASFSAASTTTATLTAVEVALGDAVGPSTGAATTVAVAGALRGRNELGAGSQAMWTGPLSNGSLIGMPARSSSAVAANTIIVGSWAYLNLVVWGGVEISVNPYATANFQTGVEGIRAFATVDSGVTFPGAFSVGSNFS